ncbi:MAG TPA: hypothetical protein VNY05_23040 [Candidatus Acidoferrales bacterium]|jgi:hypothetical protein|nr:hypothetical protein [Candidatus Acidoferrales bacterium]
METKTEQVDSSGQVDSSDDARQIFTRHSARYEVSPYFVVLDVRTFGAPPIHRRIHAGFDVDLYGNRPDHGSALSFENGEPRATLDELCAACREVVAPATEYCTIEIIPDEATLILNVKSHLEPEALLCIRITHSRGLDQPAGASEERACADVGDRLESLGVKRA